MWLRPSWDSLCGLTSLNPQQHLTASAGCLSTALGKCGASRLWDREEALISIDLDVSNEKL